MDEETILGNLHALLMAGNGVVFTESQIRRDYDEFEGKGALDDFLSRTGLTLADLLRKSRRIESCGSGRWRSVITFDTAHLAESISDKKGLKREKKTGGNGGGRPGVESGFGNGCYDTGFGTTDNFVKNGGQRSRKKPYYGTYGAAFGQQPPRVLVPFPPNNTQRQRPTDRFDSDRRVNADYGLMRPKSPPRGYARPNVSDSPRSPPTQMSHNGRPSTSQLPSHTHRLPVIQPSTAHSGRRPVAHNFPPPCLPGLNRSETHPTAPPPGLLGTPRLVCPHHFRSK